MFWTFLILGKIENFMTLPPPSDLIWENFEIGKILNFGNTLSENPPLRLKHLKLPKNHFKTNLFFCSTETFKVYSYIWEKPKSLASPHLLLKIPHFELWTFLFLELTPPPPLWIFSTFWDIF